MKYPYIGKGTESGSIVLFYEQNKGVTLESKTWASEKLQHSNCINEDLFNDITRECLSDHAIKIESQEHLDFLYEVAEGYQLNIEPVECRIFDDEYPYFVTVRGSVFHANINLPELKDKKLITIPLPPKEHEPKEWPQVGDEVAFSGKEVYKVVVNTPDSDNMIVVKGSMGEYLLADFSVCKKPLTPEEYLKEQLFQHSGVRARDGGREVASYLAKAIINGEIKGISYER